MGVSEVLLCPYRCLEYKMERLEKLLIVPKYVKEPVHSSSFTSLHTNWQAQQPFAIPVFL